MKKIIIYSIVILSLFLGFMLLKSTDEPPQYYYFNPALKQKNPFLYNAMYSRTCETDSNPIVLPLTTTFLEYPQIPSESIKYIKDSMFVVNDINSFYLYLNIHIIDYETFCNKIFEEIVNKQFISIDTNLFKDLRRRWGYVSEDPYIKKLYDQKGIVGVLNNYLNNQGWLNLFYPTPEGREMDYHGKNVNVEYIIHLASLHNIYFSLYYHYFDEPAGYYLNEYLSDTTQLKGLKPLEDPFPMKIKKPV